MLLRLADPDERYAAVRLCCDLPLPEAEYARHDGEWRLELARLPVARLEYELEGPPPPPGAPVVRVRAFSLMGGTDVKTRPRRRDAPSSGGAPALRRPR